MQNLSKKAEISEDNWGEGVSACKEWLKGRKVEVKAFALHENGESVSINFGKGTWEDF